MNSDDNCGLQTWHGVQVCGEKAGKVSVALGCEAFCGGCRGTMGRFLGLLGVFGGFGGFLGVFGGFGGFLGVFGGFGGFWWFWGFLVVLGVFGGLRDLWFYLLLFREVWKICGGWR